MSETHDGSRTSHGDYVPDAAEFASSRAAWRAAIADDEALRQKAIELQADAERHHHTYSFEWLRVPIIRLPDDIVILQELVWEYRPERIVETGVARGGSVLLDASLMRLSGVAPAVLGIDLQIFDHTHAAIDRHPAATGIQLHELDSTSASARNVTKAFLEGSKRAILILDSNHTHQHVLNELRQLAPLLPVGGYVLVADTLIEEFPQGHFTGRPWDRGNNPLTAVREFLSEDNRFAPAATWARRGLLTEFRDGILQRVR